MALECSRRTDLVTRRGEALARGRGALAARECSLQAKVSLQPMAKLASAEGRGVCLLNVGAVGY